MTNFTPPAQPDGNLTTSRPRITWLDSLKGFAIICVVIGHILDGYMSAGAFPDCLGIQRTIFQLIYTFHMPLFFIVSGFMYAMAYFDADGRPKLHKLKWQLPNIAILYFLFTALLVAFKLFFARYTNDQVSSWAPFLHSWRFPIGPYWYLYALFGFYLVSLPLVGWGRRVWSLPILLIVSATAAYFINVNGFCVNQMLLHLLFFAMGIVAQRNNITLSWTPTIIALCASVIIAVIFWGNGLGTPKDYVHYHPTVNTFVAIGICLFLWKLFSATPALDNRLFNLCGRYCLEIYVLHCFFTAGFRSILPALGLHNFYLNLILNSILSTALPLLIALTTQRLHIHTIIFRPAYALKSLLAPNPVKP